MTWKDKLPSTSLSMLYLAYSISCIGDRLWTFALVLLLEYIGGIRLVCFDQLLEEIIIMAFSSVIGNWMDQSTRKKGILTVLAVNNSNVALSAAMLAVCITISRMEDVHNDAHPNHSLWSTIYIICIVLSMITCSLSFLASEMEKIAFTKDWIVVMTKKEQSSLSGANAWMKTIDLSSSVVSPFAAGFIINSISYRFACAVFVVWNVLSMIVEAYLIIKVYNAVPELATREPLPKESETNAQCCAGKKYPCILQQIGKWLTLFYIYYVQTVFPAAFGLTMLYMTVLGFDGIAIGFAKSQGLSALWLGILRSIGGAFGVVGANLYTFIESHSSARKSGMVGMIAQQMALGICIISIWLPGSPFDPGAYFRQTNVSIWWHQLRESFEFMPSKNASETGATNIDWSTWTSNGHSIISAFTLLMGVAVARLGLYMADLSITQIMQETVPEMQRNTVFGVQDAVAQFFSVLKDVMTIILPDPKTFGILIIISVLFVSSGFLCFCYYLLTVADYTKERANAVTIGTVSTTAPTKGTGTASVTGKESIEPEGAPFTDSTTAAATPTTDRRSTPTADRFR